MYLRLLLLLLLAHLLGDFVFQGKYVLNLRYPTILTSKESSNFDLLKVVWRKTWRGNFVHVLIHGMILSLEFLFFYVWNVSFLIPSDTICTDLMRPMQHQYRTDLISIKMLCFLVLFLVGTHFIIDFFKSYFSILSVKWKHNIWFFLADQGLHLVMLVLGTLFTKHFQQTHRRLSNSFFDTETIWYHGNQSFEPLSSNPTKLDTTNICLLLICLFLIATIFAAVFIKLFLDHIEVKNETIFQKTEKVNATPILTKSIHSELKQGGFIIGILERVLILCAFMIHQPMMIGFILTAKSIARLKKLNEDKFAEYFLIGNSLSFLFAIVCGAFMNRLITLLS